MASEYITSLRELETTRTDLENGLLSLLPSFETEFFKALFARIHEASYMCDPLEIFESEFINNPISLYLEIIRKRFCSDLGISESLLNSFLGMYSLFYIAESEQYLKPSDFVTKPYYSVFREHCLQLGLQGSEITYVGYKMYMQSCTIKKQRERTS